MVYKFNEYIRFLKDRNIISSALAIVVVGMINDIVHKLIDDIIIPLTKGEINLNKKQLKKYSILIANFIFVTYILFVLITHLEKIDL